MSSNKCNASNKAPSLLEESATNNGELAPTGFKFSYVGVTHRSRRGKFQARIYKNNKEYNLGFYDLATDAAFVYDTAYRMFSAEASQHPSVAAASAISEQNKPRLLETKAAKYVFDWLGIAKKDIKRGKISERINFLSPSDFRSSRAREIAARLLDANANGSTYSTEHELREKAKKEVLAMAKLVSASSPDVLICGRRAKEFDFGTPVPLPETKSRKKAKVDNTNNTVNAISLDFPQGGLQPQVGSINFNSIGLLGQTLPGMVPDTSLSNPFQHGSPHAVSSSRLQGLNDEIARTVEQLRIEESRVLLTRHTLNQQLAELARRSNDSLTAAGLSSVQQSQLSLLLGLTNSSNNHLVSVAQAPVQQGRLEDLRRLYSMMTGSGGGSSGGGGEGTKERSKMHPFNNNSSCSMRSWQ
ncbi:predicted protein [Thalassiosira pseudonana CCMP1335]|uniref:AP2/ERF domain-containing protein n=1 Tax=Thalassiosira pseudonana TaxID=35128 RepID=B8C6B6_THAPS|nr:predicted protein [Thalassiosira pseudonana CCMP1335]EED90539.1 predicted protein [Thalassiosira pseudonana CCMP1335]